MRMQGDGRWRAWACRSGRMPIGSLLPYTSHIGPLSHKELGHTRSHNLPV